MHIATFMSLHNLRDEDLAAKVGVSRATISRVRRGKCGVSLELALRISSATDGAVTPFDFAPAAKPKARRAA